MSLSPIPRRLLPYSITVMTPDDGAEYGGEYSEAYTIDHVRFESAAALINSDYVLSDGCKGLLFIDARNSSKTGDIPVGSIVTLNGEQHMVGKVTPYLGYSKIHHWEIELQ